MNDLHKKSSNLTSGFNTYPTFVTLNLLLENRGIDRTLSEKFTDYFFVRCLGLLMTQSMLVKSVGKFDDFK